MDQVLFEYDGNDMTYLASTMASVSSSVRDDSINSNVVEAFTIPSVEQDSSSSSYVVFYIAINLRREISKLSASIGSFNVSSELFSVLDIDKPSFSRWEEV